MSKTTITESIVTDSTDPIFEFTSDGQELVVEEGVTLSNQGDYTILATVFGGLSGLRATIDGSLSTGPWGWAPFMAHDASIALTVGGTGRISGDNAMMVQASRDSSLVNHGTLHAESGFGVVITDVTQSVVENHGTIFGEGGGIEFVASGSASSSTAHVKNYGLIEAGDEASVGGSSVYFGIYSSAAVTTVFNGGTIRTVAKTGSGVEIGSQTAEIVNTGTIESARFYGVEVSAIQGSTLTNEGTISGAKGSIVMSRADDVVTNDGHLIGTATLRRGDDVYHGENGRVTGAVWGQSGNDLLIGGTRADMLGGGSGDDTLVGGGGRDTLTGSSGADRLAGGAGDDAFRFASVSDAAGDRIVASVGAVAFAGAGRAGGDRINLSAIDADTTLGGDQSFAFGTAQGVGRLWAEDVGNVTHIRGDIDGDPTVEFDLSIHDGARAQASDYFALDFIL